MKRKKTPKKILEKIAEKGAIKIRTGMKIFTHCYSKTVIEIFKTAKKQRKNFQVFVSETRPKLLGRRTAKILAKNKIPVTIFPDSIGRTVLEKCDLLLIGCETYDKNGNILNKIGSLALAEKANGKNIPVYCCTSTSKKTGKKITTIKIDQQNPAHLWKKPPKGIKILNPAYEYIPSHLIADFITE